MDNLGYLDQLSKVDNLGCHPENLTLHGLAPIQNRPKLATTQRIWRISPKASYTLNEPYFADIPDLGPPIFFVTGRLWKFPKILKTLLSSIYADSDHFCSNSCGEKNPGSIANLRADYWRKGLRPLCRSNSCTFTGENRPLATLSPRTGAHAPGRRLCLARSRTRLQTGEADDSVGYLALWVE